MISLAGIDYSMSSPGVCLHPLDEPWNPSLCKFLFFSKLKKYRKKTHLHDIFEIAHIDTYPKEGRIERYDELSVLTTRFLSKHNTVLSYIEGYSFNSRSNMAIQIGENGGILRNSLRANGILFEEVPPTTIKKFAAGHGRSDKIAIVEKFSEETGLDMLEIFEKKVVSSPVDDLADSYFICKYAHEAQNK